MYAIVVRASTPPNTDVGLTQLDHGSPASPPAGTRPDAIPPATAPMQYGTSTDDSAKAAPKLRRSRVRTTDLRKANPAPRSTIPTAARVKGTNSVSMIEAYASEKPVHRRTKQKINQTWLASHTGPIDWSISRRGRSPRAAPPATRSQKPAPKSAPPNSAYAVTAANSKTATAVLTHRDLLFGVPIVLQRRRRPVGHIVLGRSPKAEAPAHRPQDEHEVTTSPM